MTALHYAVKNKHLETARMLIDHGADLNAMTVGLPQNQLDEIFGDTYNLTGDNITPLMIAVAQENHEMVNLFISYNENIDIGAVHPLLLALKNSDHQMLRILLAHFNDSAKNIPSKNQLFNWAILHQADPCCLQILQDMHPLDQNDPAYNQSLLAQAIQHGNHAAAEYFIAQGIRPDDQPFAAPLWEQAAGLQDRHHMLDLLSRCASSKWKHLNTDHGKKSLRLICQTEPTMAAFASIGICPLISKQIINRATQVNTHALALTETQKMIDTAWFFADSLTTSASVNPAARSVFPASHFPAADGHADFPNAHSAEQVLALKNIGQALLEDYLQRLTACTMIIFPPVVKRLILSMSRSS